MNELRSSFFASATGSSQGGGTSDGAESWCFDDCFAKRMKRMSEDAPDPAQACWERTGERKGLRERAKVIGMEGGSVGE